jgi:hypothetical protein
MPYLVKVGYEKRNVYKVSSKGYFIKRSGKEVYTEWGAIDVVGLQRKHFCWHQTTQFQINKFRSLEKAKKFRVQKLKQMLREDYNKLPGSSRTYTFKVK